MKRIILLPILLFLFVAGYSQYNPREHAVLNVAIGMAQANPTDARTYMLDKTNPVWRYRPYVSTAEVLSYLSDTLNRVGQFPIIVNSGGTLSGGKIIGGTNSEYWFKDGVQDANLVLKTTISPTDSANWNLAYRKRISSMIYDSVTKILTVTLGDGSNVNDTIKVTVPTGTSGNIVTAISYNPANGVFQVDRQGLSSLFTQFPLGASTDSIKKLPVDTSNHGNNYLLAFDSINHKFKLVAPGAGGGGGFTPSGSSAQLIRGDGTYVTPTPGLVGLSNVVNVDQTNASNLATGTISATLLPASGVTAATYGDSSHVNQSTYDSKGRATSASSVSIQIAESQVTNLVTDLAGKQGTLSNGNGIAPIVSNVVKADTGRNTQQLFTGGSAKKVIDSLSTIISNGDTIHVIKSAPFTDIGFVRNDTLFLDPFQAGYGISSSLKQADSSIKIAVDTNHTNGLVTWPGLLAQNYGAGGGSGSPNTSVGSGFKIAINGTNNVKSLKEGFGTKLDSTIANEVLIKHDTGSGTGLATSRALIDSIQHILNKIGAANGIAPLNASTLVAPSYLGTGSATPGTYLQSNGTFTNPGIPPVGIFADPNAKIYAGIVRPEATGSYGSDVYWHWLSDGDGHHRYGFSSGIEATASSQFKIFFPTAARILTLLVNPDETLASYGVTVGPSVALDFANCQAYIPQAPPQIAITGNGTASPSQSSYPGSWTFSYTPTDGGIKFIWPAGQASGDARFLTPIYQGPNNIHFKQITSGLGIYYDGYTMLDEFGNPYTDTLQSNDVVKITNHAGIVMQQLGAQNKESTNQTVYNGTFANYWLIMIVSDDPLRPDTISNLSINIASTTSLALNWDDASLATNYVVERSVHTNYGFSQVYSGTISAFTDTGLTTGTHYYYRVMATNTSGAKNSGWWIIDGTPN